MGEDKGRYFIASAILIMCLLLLFYKSLALDWCVIAVVYGTLYIRTHKFRDCAYLH